MKRRDPEDLDMQNSNKAAMLKKQSKQMALNQTEEKSEQLRFKKEKGNTFLKAKDKKIKKNDFIPL